MLPAILALVDSGADESMFPAELASALGIKLVADCIQASGATAGGPTINFQYRPGIDAIVMGEKIHLSCTFNPGVPVVLLGRKDFFALFKVTFDEQAQQFTRERYPTP